jgi:hypothetical protein
LTNGTAEAHQSVVMNRSSRFGPWAWSAWCSVAVACSSQSTLPPELPDCQGGKDAQCSVQPGAGGAGSAGGTGGEDSGTTTTTTTTTADCSNAATTLGATSALCEPCIETGQGSTTGVACCPAYSDCGTACQDIITCWTIMCTGINDNGTCVSGCIDMYPSGATAFMDLSTCLQGCSPMCPSPPMPSVASEQ